MQPEATFTAPTVSRDYRHAIRDVIEKNTAGISRLEDIFRGTRDSMRKSPTLAEMRAMVRRHRH